MSQKRSLNEFDSDYQEFDLLTARQTKRQKLLEHDAKEAAVKKIEAIIKREFTRELCAKEAEINLIDERINQGRRLLDRLRACIVAQHYSKVIPQNASMTCTLESQQTVIHPAVKKFLGKTVSSSSTRHFPQKIVVSAADDVTSQTDLGLLKQERSLPNTANCQAKQNSTDPVQNEQCRGDRFKIVRKVIVGNVSKYLAPDKKEANDKSTHKWMVYVRGPKDEQPIDEFVEKVVFYLHNSYWPNDVVEITQPPFHLTRRGWGEFQIRVQLHCKGPSKKIFNITHQLKLDRTYTGLQTMGAETVIEVKLDKAVDKSVFGRFNSICHQDQDDGPLQQDEVNLTIPEGFIKQEKFDDAYGDISSLPVPENDAQNALKYSLGDAEVERSKTSNTSGTTQTLPSVAPTNPSVMTTERSFVQTVNCNSQRDLIRAVKQTVESPVKQTIESSELDSVVNSTFDCRSPELLSPVAPSYLTEDTGQPMYLELPKSSDGIEEVCSAQVVEDFASFPDMCTPIEVLPETTELEDSTDVSVEQLECVGQIDEVQSCDEIQTETVGSCSTDGIEVETYGCSETDYLSSELDLPGEACVEQVLSMEPEECEDIKGEIVVSDSVCVEPVMQEEVSIDCESCEVVENENGEVHQDQQSDEPDGETVCKMETDDSDNLTTPTKVPDAVEHSTPEPLNGCLENEPPEKLAEGEESVRCVDATGRVFVIPRRFLKSSPVVKMQPKAETTPLDGSLKDGAVVRGELKSDSMSSVVTPKVASAVRLITPSKQLNVLSPPVGAHSRSTVLNLQNVVEGRKEFIVMSKTRPLTLPSASSVIPLDNKISMIPRQNSNELTLVMPQASPSFAVPRQVILPAQRGTVTLLKQPGPSNVRLVVSNQKPNVGAHIIQTSCALGSSFSGTRLALIRNDVPSQPLALHSVGLGLNQSAPVVLNKLKPDQAIKINGPGSISLVGSRQPIRAAVVSSMPRVRIVSSPISSPSSLLSSPPMRPRVVRHLRQTLTPIQKSSVFQTTRPFPPLVTNSGGRSLLQTCVAPPTKQEKPPVFLLVPSTSKANQMQASLNCVQPPVKQLVILSNGGKEQSPSQVLRQQPVLARAVSNNMRARKPHPGVMTSSVVSVMRHTDENFRTRGISLLRPEFLSSKKSLLKRNLFAPPLTAVFKSENSESAVGRLPSNLVQCSSVAVSSLPKSETLMTTKIGNQKIVLKIDASDGNEHLNQKSDTKLNLPSGKSIFGSQSSAIVSGEKCLMFKSLREPLKTPEEDFCADVCLEDLKTLDDLMRSLVKKHPLYISSSNSRIKNSSIDCHIHPYCASSYNTFLQWNVGKRRAAELCRAVAVLRKASRLLKGGTTFRGEELWSKRQLIVWCRHQMYTPLDKEIAMPLEMETVDEPVVSGAFTSLTSHSDVISRLDLASETKAVVPRVKPEDVDDAEVDVIGSAEVNNVPEKKEKTRKRGSPVKVASGVDVIPLSTEAQFVQETAGKIGIRFHPTSVLPLECPDILSSTAEEMIAAAMRAFVEELVRTTCAHLFRSGRNPLELDISSVCHALQQMDRGDFLTNHSLGVSEQDTNPS